MSQVQSIEITSYILSKKHKDSVGRQDGEAVGGACPPTYY